MADCFTIDGSVSANGGDWRSPQAGGGSAGGIFIHTKTIDGAGVIEASGGGGYDGPLTSHGGGGSGGRVALYYKVNNYVGESKWVIKSLVMTFENNDMLYKIIVLRKSPKK